jgi:hypothetical protein
MIDIINYYLYLIENISKEHRKSLVNTLHIICNHDSSFGFCSRGNDHYYGKKFEESLLLKLKNNDFENIAMLFDLGRLDENNQEEWEHYCNSREDLSKAKKFRRKITVQEKMLYLEALNCIYGYDDRLKITKIMFREKHSFEETQELIKKVSIENKQAIEENWKTNFKGKIKERIINYLEPTKNILN